MMMKKYLNLSLIFAVYGLCAGVYYREFTKFNGFSGRTMLGMAHPHILGLGLLVFILLALFVKVLKIENDRKLKIADIIYICGLLAASVMMMVRGTMEVLGCEFTSMTNGMISGIAGLGHMAVAAGMIMYIVTIRKYAE